MVEQPVTKPQDIPGGIHLFNKLGGHAFSKQAGLTNMDISNSSLSFTVSRLVQQADKPAPSLKLLRISLRTAESFTWDNPMVYIDCVMRDRIDLIKPPEVAIQGDLLSLPMVRDLVLGKTTNTKKV